MAEPNPELVYRENDPEINRRVKQDVDSIASNAVLRVTADRLKKTDSPDNEESIRRFARQYVNDVIITGAIKKIESGKVQVSSVSKNQEMELNLFAKTYVNDVIIHGAMEKYVKLADNDDAEININEFVNSAIQSSLKTVAQEEKGLELFASELVGEVLNNIAFNSKQLLIEHHQRIMKLYAKETKQKVHALLEKQRNNYLELKSMMKQATHEKLQKSKMSRESLSSCEILKKFCDPIQKDIPDLYKPIQKETSDPYNPIQQDTPAILQLTQQDATDVFKHIKQDTSDVAKPQTISTDLPAKNPGKKNPFRSIARSVIGRARRLFLGCTKPNKTSPVDLAEDFLIS